MAKADLCKGCQYKSNYKIKEQECEELKKKKEENETFYLTKYTNKDSYCLELEHKRNIYKQALNTIKEYCKYMIVFNNANKTNKGLDIENVLDILDETEENN